MIPQARQEDPVRSAATHQWPRGVRVTGALDARRNWADTGTVARCSFSNGNWGGHPLPADRSLAGEARLDVGQPDPIRPSVAADRGPLAAPEIEAIDQQPANASGAHFAEGDFLTARLGHAPLRRGRSRLNSPASTPGHSKHRRPSPRCIMLRVNLERRRRRATY
jgi:hypothetical protein